MNFKLKFWILVIEFLVIVLQVSAWGVDCTKDQTMSPQTYQAQTSCACYGVIQPFLDSATNEVRWYTCRTCAIGRYWAPTCTACNAGKYSNTVQATECTNCNAGTYSLVGSGSCTNCDAGTYSGAVSGTCTTCPTNSNSPSSSTTASDCICNAGSSGPNGGTCTTCTVGKYKDIIGTTLCINCGIGTYSAVAGASVCTNCDAGKYHVVNGASMSSVCTNCGTGKYSVVEGASACTNCVAGKYSGTTGSSVESVCTNCVSGKYSATVGATAVSTCLNCDSGKFSDAGSMICTICSSGSFCNPCTSVNDCACNAGYTGANGATCTTCTSGKYKISPGNASCTNCDAGTYSGTVGATTVSTCIGCVAGKNSVTIGASSVLVCTNCSVGTYSSTPAASVCTRCVSNSFISGTGNTVPCLCNAGYTITNEGNCTLCAEGKYKATIGNNACQSCPDLRYASNAERTACFVCPGGTEYIGKTCVDCPIGQYSNDDTNWKCTNCKSGFYALTKGNAKCTPCGACPDGFHRKNCTTTTGGGSCVACATCESGKVNVGCMNRAGHTDQPGVCRSREYTVRTPQCDEEDKGYGLGGYTFSDLFGVSQDDASFQCRHRCDGDQNAMSGNVYKKMTNRLELVSLFGNNRTFNGGACNGPYACDVSSCVIFGSSDDSQQSFRLESACPVFVDGEMSSKFWSAVETKPNDEIVSTVNLMRTVQCESCDVCGQNEKPITDWGRGCARECTQIKCPYLQIYDWTEPDITKKCKRCEDLDDRRLCKSTERSIFQNYDVSGRLPKFYMEGCVPKTQNAIRERETTYGSCVKCSDSTDACGADTDYYHSCQKTAAGVSAVCKTCINRESVRSTYYDGQNRQTIYCQRTPCAPVDGVTYTGISIDVQPQRMCYTQCLDISCSNTDIELPCVLPHQKRCKPALQLDRGVTDILYRPLRQSPAHTNILEPATETLHLFSSFENTIVDHDTSQLYKRAQCVWNADHILDNSMNPAGISNKFQDDCRLWIRDPRVVYPLIPLQNTVTDTSTEFPRRVLINASAHAVSYKRTYTPDYNVERQVSPPEDAFPADTYLELDLTNTTNATLATFIPDDRNIDAIDWVPRWRVSVHARLISSGDSPDTTSVTVTTDTVDECVSCFLLTLK